MPKKPDRRDLCFDLLQLRLKHAKVFSAIDSIKAELIGVAGDVGEGFREIFSQKGQVTVAAPKAKEFKGDLPEVDADVFHRLPEAKRQKLIDDGLIRLVPNWTRDFHGRVDVKVF